jgi:hypothetical protein
MCTWGVRVGVQIQHYNCDNYRPRAGRQGSCNQRFWGLPFPRGPRFAPLSMDQDYQDYQVVRHGPIIVTIAHRIVTCYLNPKLWRPGFVFYSISYFPPDLLQAPRPASI